MIHRERKQREMESRKNDMLQAALNIAEKKGWEAVTIRKIATAIEYTTSVVYEHFKGKDDLLQEIAEQGFAKMNEEFNRPDMLEDPADELMRHALLHWEFANNNKALYQLMYFITKGAAESAHSGMVKLRDLFIRLTGKEGEELQAIMINWVCLNRGSIEVLNASDGQPWPWSSEEKAKELYVGFMKRFIESIKK